MQVNKTDANDAFGLTQIVRTGWYRPVDVKSMESHKLRLLLAARARLVSMRTALYSQIRGLLKTFGVVLAPGKGGSFERLVLRGVPEDRYVTIVIESAAISRVRAGAHRCRSGEARQTHPCDSRQSPLQRIRWREPYRGGGPVDPV